MHALCTAQVIKTYQTRCAVLTKQFLKALRALDAADLMALAAEQREREAEQWRRLEAQQADSEAWRREKQAAERKRLQQQSNPHEHGPQQAQAQQQGHGHTHQTGEQAVEGGRAPPDPTLGAAPGAGAPGTPLGADESPGLHEELVLPSFKSGGSVGMQQS